MAGRNRPSFLKKQKEAQRRVRATMKREGRRARKQAALLARQAPEAPPEPAPAESEGAGESQS